ncbi:MAG: aldehyde dehydrogenase family protein [Pseudomonadales bacterium]|nr:aldehyde dehydrogenase family protein [Pseudomonadales bacterium]
MDKSFQTRSPANGDILCTTPYASNEVINQALNLAFSGHLYWRSQSIEARANVCRAALDYFETNKDAIALEISQQMGRPIRYCGGEVAGLQERGHHMINIAEQSLSDVQVAAQPGFKRFIRREPVGTVLVIAPWNYPYLTAVNSIIPALMAGNTVILKHSAQTPLCAKRFQEAFDQAGLPEGIFQHLYLNHQQVDDLIKSPEIDYVAFTGSVEGGKAIEQAACGRFIGVGLELGGKDPAYVRSDADLNQAVENLVDGAFFNSGQSCCGIERIYVDQSIYDSFVEAFVALTRQYQLGDPLKSETTLGPVVSERAAEAINEQIFQAISAGAKPCVDIQLFANESLPENYLPPQVLVNVDHNMAFMTEETFGPAVGVMPVKSDAQAVQLMNDSHYGLTASIWTRDVAAAENLGGQLETGTVFMNRCDYLDPALVWTGVKSTGRGGTLSVLGYQGLTQPKSFHLKLSQ